MEWREIPVNIILCYAGFLLMIGIGFVFTKITDFIDQSIKNYKWKKFMKRLDSIMGRNKDDDIAHKGLEKFIGVLKKRD